MYINGVENLLELAEKHPELHEIRDITANHGEKSEISVLCEIICKLYAKIDALSTPATSAKLSSRSRE